MAAHPLVVSTTWALYVRIAQFVFATLVMALSAYTISIIQDWNEVKFTVAAVCE
jgi:hypothetical protein